MSNEFTPFTDAREGSVRTAGDLASYLARLEPHLESETLKGRDLLRAETLRDELRDIALRAPSHPLSESALTAVAELETFGNQAYREFCHQQESRHATTPKCTPGANRRRK